MQERAWRVRLTKAVKQNIIPYDGSVYSPDASFSFDTSGLNLDLKSFLGLRLQSWIEESSNPPQRKLPSLDTTAELNL